MTALQPRSGPARPRTRSATIAFITGCGRSGTTVLGRLLSKHRDVMYLNDQHMLWAGLWPRYDVAGWVPFDPAAPAPLALSASDAARDPAAAEAFRAMLEERRADRRVVVDKLAQNNMRMPFLRAIAPGCLLINIVRSGIDVAHSIAARIERGRWYGPRDRKWACIVAHAEANGYAPLVPLCSGPLQRALLEWRLSVDAADAFFEGTDADGVLRLRYEDLVAEPTAVCEDLEKFLGIVPRPVMRQFAATVIARRTPSRTDVPANAEVIAGPALRRLGYWPRTGTPGGAT